MKSLRFLYNRIINLKKVNYLFRKVFIFIGLTLLSLTIVLNSYFVNAQQIPEDPKQAILNGKMLKMEQRLEKEYETFFNKNIADSEQSSLEMAAILAEMDEKTGTNSAVVWVMPEEKYLHLVYLSKKGEIIVKDIEDAPLNKITKVVEDFYREIESVNSPMDLAQSKQLYKWIIEPYQKEFLEAENIDNILFCMGNGVRLLPLSALYDGEKFLVEKYNISRIPAFNLINAKYEPMKNATVLAMGASKFLNNDPLPAVTLEIENIDNRLQRSSITSPTEILLNENFTLPNMQQQLKTNSFQIVHLATHANFNPGDVTDSYIQLWDDKLTLDQMSNMPWQNPPDLLVLSACNTALGDRDSQLGFTGIALQSGVNSALGTLWSVSDLGTFALITEFYEQLINQSQTNLTKAEALRQAQNLLLQGEIYFEDNRLITPHGNINLPESLAVKGKVNLSHPFYWAGFTLISSPW
ncbi:CHAT domain-containing protein [Geminocystis sp. NIES-3709]|uniref:CHAT domain-containing protein n=1 Tax=Geminocystis sp. NIES-3709 TaxID=1617448 RepID=UPI0008245570|nr:CHAT domain-containing protein [Geminocystis sp. NIES-3709]